MFPCGLTPASVRLSVWSGRRRGSSQRAARLYARGPRSRLPDGLGLDQTPGNALRRGQKRTGRTPTPDFRLPSLCFVIYRSVAAGSPAPGARRPRTGAGLPSRAACGRGHPSPFYCPAAGPTSSFFVRSEARGDSLLPASPPVPRCVSSPVLGVICKRGPLSLLPCLVSPGASPPPCYGGVCAQGSGTQHCVPVSPPAPGFAWENPSVNYAAGRSGLGRGQTDSGQPHPTPGRPPRSRRYSVITGKDLLFQKPWW